MPHSRTPKPGDAYYLPKYQYRTVVNFCLQYNELKEDLQFLDGWHSKENDGMPHGTGTSDPTAKEAQKRADIGKKISIIEDTTEKAAGYLAPYIMQSITCDTCTYDSIGAPVSKDIFFKVRRKVYYEIAQQI